MLTGNCSFDGYAFLSVTHQDKIINLSLEKQKEILEDLLKQLQTNSLTANFVKRHDFRIGFHDNHKKFNLDEQNFDKLNYEQQKIYNMLNWQRYEIWHNATSEELTDFCENILLHLMDLFLIIRLIIHLKKQLFEMNLNNFTNCNVILHCYL